VGDEAIYVEEDMNSQMPRGSPLMRKTSIMDMVLGSNREKAVKLAIKLE
jgi:hypothetical protein